ncbi:40S ribosomal protein S17, putative [Trypanosoma equiperdum]|uniref:40S ribosomal protein S17, putative n=4 Tax=Trypanozoon TaxID=39700 RepID=Q382Z8_TRYB2|nr:40S ribosomal protein S17, putative [Trypanosoma brucei gambiense DAL972]XP_011780474.1 40S ribosomal protein S17, putative [Trypanosoma brucei gambiense DAL972]XP_829244.1 40S ribosomal protein S17, putative [Trypanosoma brucei brucei TREU927]XP_829245.1 40S ribosomal protein S17, putative [Trypanosoma brucei brucei TREU927]4V8M_AL Chain AL, 40S RIBOSOMAL PROTEIN S17, PUTATIVE [Trypanosoma brucei brucei TREU927]8OVA_AL Chain AL, 40S ribosomal protein S17, putative [Trypanosoma brucei bruce|eukprot:XP_011780473.1 40S ribosomal protein S17, putative [Trypanosoma brucei gambiense DAL972]
MGKIRTKTVKRASKQIVEKYFSKLNKDFYQNKRIVMDVTIARSKKLKNKIAGYATHIMKRLARGPVRGISLKLQEEERERRMDYVPEVSHVDQAIQDGIRVDKQTLAMLKRMETGVPRHVLPNVVAAPNVSKGARRGGPARK